MTKALLPLLLGAAVASAQDFALRDGDRVVFYGDSITEDGGYTRAVEAYVATRFPEWTIAFHNAGVGGDRVSGGSAGSVDVRLERDVLAFKPTVVTVMLGMNDAGYKAFDPGVFDTYSRGYRKIVARLKEALPDVRLTLIQPSPFDDVSRPPGFPEGYNAVLRRYGTFVQELGRESGALVVDLNGPLVAGIEKVGKNNPALARQLVPDRIHPGPAGHLVMAGALLRAWRAPTAVTRTEIETSAAGSRLLRADSTEISGLSAKGPYLEWVQTDKVLPLPWNFADGDTELAELAGAGLEALDQQILRITGLSSGRYELLIDGKVVGRFNESALLTGVNLAREDTPMRGQAEEVLWNAQGRHHAANVRRRLLVASAGDPKLGEAAAILGGLDTLDQAERRRLVKPAPHRYEVRRSYAFR